LGLWSRAIFGVLGLPVPARSAVERRSLPTIGGWEGRSSAGVERERWPVRKEGNDAGKSWLRSAPPHGRRARPSARRDVCRSRSRRFAAGPSGPLVERPAAYAGDPATMSGTGAQARGQRRSARERCARSAAGLLAVRWQECSSSRSGAGRTYRSARCSGGAPLSLARERRWCSARGRALPCSRSARGPRWKRRSASTAERRSLGRSGGGSGALSAESEGKRRPARKSGARLG
jgi:hypothetical protein